MDKIRAIILSDAPKHVKLSNILKYVFVDICGIDQRKYFILASYTLREHRRINDLDMNVEITEFFKLHKACDLGLGRIEFHEKQIRWMLDLTAEYNKLLHAQEADFSIEAFMKRAQEGYPNRTFSLSHLTKTKGFCKDANGHRYFSLKTLLRWKTTVNRPKDAEDIKMLRGLLKTKK